ncbi:hypothetical protein RJ640_001165 [Escallonia rubra]|uniref:Uncharacterized protein n=1 Tax=Escallonia rubra TaxID=112253 RepID=A0AA88U3N2_9ASTE|nr:hypothetical protein RJ640_001165 [Escallonia rubra]
MALSRPNLNHWGKEHSETNVLMVKESTNLVVLDMCYSSLETFWKGTKPLKLLKLVDLSHSHGLVSGILDFSLVPNLEKLVLKYCINLVEVHESIRVLQRLILLDLKGCRNLRKLPTGIHQLKSLEKLILSGCSKLHDESPAYHLDNMEPPTLAQVKLKE